MQRQKMKNLSIFILGTTAVGKTKLSLQLCKYLNGQIVSCDSKQLYKHANLMTAKSSSQQLNLYKHNMVDCLQLQQSSYNRNKFYQQVKYHTQRIWKQNKTPIFIGGTNYYIQPILYNVQDLGRLNNQNYKKNNQKDQKDQTNILDIQINSKNQNNQHNQQIKQQNHYQQNLNKEQNNNLEWIKLLTKQQKYIKLKQVDPLMAQKLHKNDSNRITSFLQRYYKYNKKPSDNYKPYTNQLNNPNTILFWVRNSDKMQHKIVVQSRIKQMLGKQGILQILSVFVYLDIYHYDKQMQQKSNQSQQKLQQFKLYLNKKLTSSGIGQSIGYKQFYQFYFYFRNNLLNNNNNKHNVINNNNNQLNSNNNNLIHNNNNDEITNQFKQIISLYQNKQNNYQKIYSILQQYYHQIQSKLLNHHIKLQAQQQLITNTLSYCKRQITWIKNRIFLNHPILLQKLYILDLAKKQRKYSRSQNQNQQFQQIEKTFDKKDLFNRFQTKVKSKAISIIQQIQNNGFDSAQQKYQSHSNQFKQIKQQIKLQSWKKYTCKQCQVQLNGLNQWQQHLNSKRHSKRIKYLQKKVQIDKWIQSRKKRQAQTLQNKKQQQNKNQN